MFILACSQSYCFFKQLLNSSNVVGELNITSIIHQAESYSFAEPSINSILFSATIGVLIGYLLSTVWKKYKWHGVRGHNLKEHNAITPENSYIIANKSITSKMVHSASRKAHASIGTWPSKKSHYSHYRDANDLMQCEVLNVIDDVIKDIAPKYKQLRLTQINNVNYSPLSPINPTWFSGVIRELLSNAIKHNWIGNEIKVELRPSVKANDFIVCIADNGTGLPNKITSKLSALNMNKEAVSSSLFTNTESTNLASIKVGLFQVEGSLDIISARQFMTKVILKIPLLDQKQASGKPASFTKCAETKGIALTIEKATSENEKSVEQVSERVANYHSRLSSADNIKNREDSKFLARFTLMIRENYANENFNRPEAAKHILMTEKTLSRKLNYHYKLGFSEILRQYRLEQAKTLLLNGEQVTTAAYETGFNSPSYFSKCFRD
jgi:AraC-like DNA-binding protein